MSDRNPHPPTIEAEDRVDAAWIWDRVAQGAIFLGGISAIVFVIAIFVFVAREGLGFMLTELDLSFFFTSPGWRPTSEPEPEFGGLAPGRDITSQTALQRPAAPKPDPQAFDLIVLLIRSRRP